MPAVMVDENGSGWSVVADSSGRLAAPPFVTWWERLAHAWHLQSPRLMAMDVPEPRPRIVFHRDVRERIEALAPFFTIGPTLLAAVRGDSLYWVADLFVASDDYPLSEAVMFAGSPRHYVRKAATAFVQAQTGRVPIVAEAHPDVVTQSWMRRFPWLFVPRAEVSAGLDALRPPSVDWATVQGNALARTGFPRDTHPAAIARPERRRRRGGRATTARPSSRRSATADRWLGRSDWWMPATGWSARSSRAVANRRARSGTVRLRPSDGARCSRRCSTRRTAPASAISGDTRAADAYS